MALSQPCMIERPVNPHAAQLLADDDDDDRVWFAHGTDVPDIDRSNTYQNWVMRGGLLQTSVGQSSARPNLALHGTQMQASQWQRDPEIAAFLSDENAAQLQEELIRRSRALFQNNVVLYTGATIRSVMRSVVQNDPGTREQMNWKVLDELLRKTFREANDEKYFLDISPRTTYTDGTLPYPRPTRVRNNQPDIYLQTYLSIPPEPLGHSPPSQNRIPMRPVAPEPDVWRVRSVLRAAHERHLQDASRKRQCEIEYEPQRQRARLMADALVPIEH